MCSIGPEADIPSQFLNTVNSHDNVQDTADQIHCKSSTAEVAAHSPRLRRKSTPFVDAIHDLPETLEMAPAQLYSTESGRLFHSGRIAIATVGLPARGKT